MRPGGIFVITSPLNFLNPRLPGRLPADDAQLPAALLSPYATRIAGYQGHHAFPHTVHGGGVQAPRPPRTVQPRAERLVAAYHDWLERTESSLPVGEKFRCQFERSPALSLKGERRQIADYYAADFTDRGHRCGGLPARERSAPMRTGRRSAELLRFQVPVGRRLDEERSDAEVRLIDWLSWASMARPGTCWTPMRARGLMPEPRCVSSPPPPPGRLRLDDPSRHDGRLDHHDDRVRAGASRSLRPPLLRCC